jgi:hypothetical protein
MDSSVPTALIFLDSLGSTLPFKDRFTFKELSDFCHREGIVGLTEQEQPDLKKVAYLVEGITKGHIKIVAGPMENPAQTRRPISKVDLDMGQKVQNAVATKHAPTTKPANSLGPMKLYAHATLHDGTSLHVIEIHDDTCIGVDDDFVAHEFSPSEVRHYVNMDEPLVRLGTCRVCGEDLCDSTCTNCGTAS